MEEKKDELDSAQQSAVDIRINSVVSAGAGSGKTKVLSKRFTNLLVTDKDCTVDQILTLTFTKKATVEMTGRIYSELSKACPEKAKDFYKANIKTLDSYCSQVARNGSRFYGISPDFTIDEELIVQKINNMALPFILEHRNNPAIMELAATKDFADIARQLFVETILEASTVAEPFDFKSALKCQKEFVRAEWKKTGNELNSLHSELIKELESFEGNRINYIVNITAASEIEPDEIPEVNFDEKISEERKNYIRYFTGISSVKQTGARSNSDGIKAVHNMIKAKTAQLCSLENYIYGSSIVSDLIPLLEEFQNVVNSTKRNTNILTYSDVSSLAIKILVEHPEIRNIEKQKYKYIMIDEFQDNNSMQRDLLFLLAEKKDRVEKSIPSADELEKNKLFFVGDEKQSIYKFRGADVSVFRNLSDNFTEGNLELQTNYRSNPALIAAFNNIFGGAEYPPSETSENIIPCVFYNDSDVKEKNQHGETVPEYEAVYHNVRIPELKLKDLTPKNVKDFYSQHVHFAIYNSEEETEPGTYGADESECYWVVDKIKQLVSKKGGYKYSQIAILFKSYTLLPVYEKILLNEGVPYVSETVKGFFADGPVNDIMSFLRLQAYPNDKLSFANILRSPFANLSSPEMQAVLSVAENEDNLFDVDPEGILCEQSLKRFNYCKSINETLHEKIKVESLAEIISYLWYETGYRYETVWNQTVFMYASSYDRLFELARQADLSCTGLSEFVDSIDNYQSESEKLDGMEIPLESSDGVHILSIHKSKGLEFPVVFVCGTGHTGMRDSNSSIAYCSEEYGVTINTPPSPVTSSKSNYFYEMQKELSEKMTCAELRRVAYVALTRAETELFVTGSYKFSNFDKYDFTPDGDKRPSSILEVLLPTVAYSLNNGEKSDSSFTFEQIPQREKKSQASDKDMRFDLISQLNEKYENAQVIEKTEPGSDYVTPSHLHDEDDETYAYEKNKIKIDTSVPFYEIDKIVESSVLTETGVPEFTYANFGTVAHAHMEAAVKGSEPVIPNREFNGLHGDDKKVEAISKICGKMKESFLASEPGLEVKKAVECNKLVKTEYSFRSLVNGKIINGQIDLLFQNPGDSGYTIIDYKTNKTVEPEKYFVQLACYRDAVAKMLGIKSEEIKCGLYYLRHGKYVDITKECGSINLDERV